LPLPFPLVMSTSAISTIATTFPIGNVQFRYLYHYCCCRCLCHLCLQQTSTSGQPIQDMDLLSEGTMPITTDKATQLWRLKREWWWGIDVTWRSKYPGKAQIQLNK
jgi:hypothetical protein